MEGKIKELWMNHFSQIYKGFVDDLFCDEKISTDENTYLNSQVNAYQVMDSQDYEEMLNCYLLAKGCVEGETVEITTELLEDIAIEKIQLELSCLRTSEVRNSYKILNKLTGEEAVVNSFAEYQIISRMYTDYLGGADAAKSIEFEEYVKGMVWFREKYIDLEMIN